MTDPNSARFGWDEDDIEISNDGADSEDTEKRLSPASIVIVNQPPGIQKQDAPVVHAHITTPAVTVEAAPTPNVTIEAPTAPDVAVTVEAAKAPDVHVDVAAPTVTVEAPNVTVEAPAVTVEAAQITVEAAKAPDVQVFVPDPQVAIQVVPSIIPAPQVTVEKQDAAVVNIDLTPVAEAITEAAKQLKRPEKLVINRDAEGKITDVEPT